MAEVEAYQGPGGQLSDEKAHRRRQSVAAQVEVLQMGEDVEAADQRNLVLSCVDAVHRLQRQRLLGGRSGRVVGGEVEVLQATTS